MNIIELIKFLFLGFVQGITEPIPVSSSGHLLVFQSLVRGLNTIDFEILATLTNFGSLCAILIIFRKKVADLFKGFFGYLKSHDEKYYYDYKYCWLVVVATIPAGLVGIIVEKLGLFDFLESNVRFVGLTLIITAAFLYFIKDFKGMKSSQDITFKDSIIIGLFQMVALLPGISRSGSTIVGGMLRSLKREVAFDFSFILYIPISLATMILGVKDLFEASLTGVQVFYYLIATVMAFIFTYIGTKWFRNIVKNGKLIYFVVYCLIVGSLIIIFF